MTALLQENWYFFVLALVLGIALAWWLLSSRKTRVDFKPQDTLDESSGPAQRNQALIDAAPAAAPEPPPAVATPVEPVPEPQPNVVETQEPAPAPVSAPAPEAAAAPEAPPAAPGDDLTRIKGLGPKLKALLAEFGITSFAQIAAWDDAAIDEIDAKLGKFQGRIRRDNWVEQARFLAEGDTAGYEGKFGKL